MINSWNSLIIVKIKKKISVFDPVKRNQLKPFNRPQGKMIPKAWLQFASLTLHSEWSKLHKFGRSECNRAKE